jgi:hypothetical protein
MAVAHLRSLIQFFEKFREDGVDEIFIEAEKKAEILGIVLSIKLVDVLEKKDGW